MHAFSSTVHTSTVLSTVLYICTYLINMLAGLTYVHTCHNLLLSSLQTLMSATEQTHVHQLETVSIQMVPLHVTVPLAMSWIPVDRVAQVSPFRSIPSMRRLFASLALCWVHVNRVSMFSPLCCQTKRTPHHLAFTLHSIYHHPIVTIYSKKKTLNMLNLNLL